MNRIAAKKELRKAIDVDKPCADGIARLAGRPILIYGAGNYGRIIHRLLTENGIPKDFILGFLDEAATDCSTLFSLPVRRPADPNNTDDIRKEAEVVISVYCSLGEQAAISARLHDYGYCHVRTCYETAIAFHSANNPRTRISRSEFLRVNMDNALKGCEFWGDERSLDTYTNHFVGYARCDVGRFNIETGHKQYFAPPPLLVKGHKRFIDCGAFDGDTIRDLMEVSGKSESLALFEPCKGNFENLRAYISGNEDQLAERIALFPCGVSDRAEQLRFDSGAAAASGVSENGDTFIQCVAIDDALHGFNPTFIKMDIEGAEPKALRGAALTIRKCKPDLAISIYHSLAHFWEIPELVLQLVPEYRLYLRTYGAAGFETTMYAVAEQ
ncbi:MAG TPA: FkbM family methyltransferase [Thermodesulfovibrionales bacterium]|nr:FkbM family methyltransferase [Thermodesulfovibrionales bacterium]